MKELVERIFKNWKSTLIGALIIIGALAAVYAGKATLTEAGAFIVGGITLFFIKDKQDPKGPSPATAWMFALALLLVVASCNRKSTTTTSELQTITIVKDSIAIHDSIVWETYTVPVDSLVLIGYVECDTLTNKPKTMSLAGKGKRMNTKLNLNSSGALSLSTTCEAYEDSLQTAHRTISQLSYRLSAIDQRASNVVTVESNRYLLPLILSCVLNLVLLIIFIKSRR
jgi:hypothetical protein